MSGGVVHGGLRDRELAALGLARTEILDLSANLNPAGPHPAVLEAARTAELGRYPEPDAATLRDALAEAAGVPPAQLLVTPGATAALHLIARVCLERGDACALWPPTFGEYEPAVRVAGGRVVAYQSAPPAFVVRADIAPAPLAILCNPNNPTGTYLERATVEAITARVRVLVLDVAYDAFVDGAWRAGALVEAGAPVLVVHSLTKLHATPGLRLGYVTGPEPLIARLAALQPAWSIGATELAAGLAMLAADATQRRAALDAAATRAALAAGIRAHDLALVEGRANFLLVEVGAAGPFRERLLRHGFAVRDCSSFGLPEWVRIATPPAAIVERLVAAVAAAAVR
ncbi:MAG: aminotransferase class I/II-fold pyridoxal phosphate-dependent enzyme [Chloroflexi bacterium]|nr:aminotransferase class I/II-fold pyridoxal phosphate-dependent enzyme [Chloroflexota bacterium]